ncbi:hypothetical protein HWV62_22265 [Athelia sp. TMB]|nr:hypothetical protein HWV62_22265 [Athelia sp. TMB]
MAQVNDERRQRIAFLSQELVKIDDERTELLRQLEGLDARAVVVKMEHAALLNLDSPTSRLPDEVLAMIFVAGIGLRSRFGELVSHVSRHWRRISISTPRLWANVEILTVPDPENEDARRLWPSNDEHDLKGGATLAERKRRKDRAAMYFSRSRSYPMNIRIECTDSRDALLDFLDLISHHIDHCRQLRLVGVSSAVVLLLGESLRSRPVPLLASLTLQFQWDSLWQEGTFSFEAPLLKCLHLIDIGRNHRILLQPAFARVTCLRLHSFTASTLESYETIRAGLMQLKSLHHLELSPNTDIIDSAALQPIVLPTLRLLRYGWDFPLKLPGCLRLINAASAEVLSIGSWSGGEPGPLEAQFPSLKHIILTEGSTLVMSESMIDAFRRGFPHIEQLTYRVHLLNTFANALSYILPRRGPSDSAQWPRLHTLSIDAFWRPRHDDPALHTVLQNAGPSIRKLRLSRPFFKARHASDAMQRLRDLVEVEEWYDDWPTPFAGPDRH